jgi:hypothetical protein
MSRKLLFRRRHEPLVQGPGPIFRISVLGTFSEDQLPTDATMSVEIDILPIADDNSETERLGDLIEGVAGEFSPFEELHEFSIDGVDLSPSALPTGWRGRLVKVQNANTAAPDGEPQYTGWCLDKEDLSVAKLCAFRKKDQNFVAALVRSALVDRQTILTGSAPTQPGWSRAPARGRPGPASSSGTGTGRPERTRSSARCRNSGGYGLGIRPLLLSEAATYSQQAVPENRGIII